ncbi:MAG: hypothetical protein ABIT36_11740, partial [Steroidobacteraceae bacterium]
MGKLLFIPLLATVLFGASAHCAEATPKRELLQPPKREIASPLTDYFAVRGSYFGASMETFLRLDSSARAPGTPLSAEEDLSLNDRLDQATFEMILRMRERNRLRVDFSQFKRHGETTLTRPFFFGDDTYLISDRVVTDFNWSMLGLTYTYSFLKFEKFELGAGLGLHLIQAEAIGEVPARRLRQDFQAVGPFPSLALDASWAVWRRFSVNARVQYFSAGIDNFDGLLKQWHADVQYRWFRNLAVGV